MISSCSINRSQVLKIKAERNYWFIQIGGSVFIRRTECTVRATAPTASHFHSFLFFQEVQEQEQEDREVNQRMPTSSSFLIATSAKELPTLQVL